MASLRLNAGVIRILLGLAFSLLGALISTGVAESSRDHWAFQPFPLVVPTPPPGIDRLIDHRLEAVQLKRNPRADRGTLIRRVAFVLTGLPPTLEERSRFLQDHGLGAYERMVDRYLGSPRFGERWAGHWLDAVGYADSNGYFGADTDRPLAYRYRDYVIRSLNADKPFDRFIQEQLAGDELAAWKPGDPVTPRILDLLEATHLLRNGQDGTGESDGNPDEVRTDRYYALESSMQILGTSLLGLTVQCAKCHDHKFEPFTMRDYYGFQAFLYPALNMDRWVKPNERVVDAILPGELDAWARAESLLDASQAALRTEFSAWIASHQPPPQVLFTDTFSSSIPLATKWSTPSATGPAAVHLDSDQAPAARAVDDALQLLESGAAGDRWIETRTAFDWEPAKVGDWIQVSFDLVTNRITGAGPPAERIGYFIALAGPEASHPGDTHGNILIDGNPKGASAVHAAYPGSQARSLGSIGSIGYQSGHNYGVRITRDATNHFTLEHRVDGLPDGPSLSLPPQDLVRGRFGFEYCCGRSFVVDNVVVEASQRHDPEWAGMDDAFQAARIEHQARLDRDSKAITARRTPKPGRIAWVTDVVPVPPEVHLLKRGNHKTPGPVVTPAFPVFLNPSETEPAPVIAVPTATGTGLRLAWASWLTQPGSPQASLLARVTVNRLWQHCFGLGLVATPENLGRSGAKPSNPELLNTLAHRFIQSGWSQKQLLREILLSETFRQSSAPRPEALAADRDDILLWRYPIRRLDAESIRDAMLAISGRLGSKTGGPYVPTERDRAGEVVVDESRPDGWSRSIFLQKRRTQVQTFLSNFDAPAMVFNCTRRLPTTMPLQSLSLLNSEFVLRRARDLAARLQREMGPDAKARIRRGFLLATGREPDRDELRIAQAFLITQRDAYGGAPEADTSAWADFCQSLLVLNASLYVD